MKISIEGLGKKFGSRWIFRNIDMELTSPNRYALVGHNGAGKSTFLNVITSKIPTTKGTIKYEKQGKTISTDHIYRSMSVATTSMQLIEEFTLLEHITFHLKFRKVYNDISALDIIKLLELKSEKGKLISNFSSGMKQRVKIGLAILTISDILILDEPGSNLDVKSKEWYQKMMSEYMQERLVIVASNEESDYSMCNERIDISEYKPTA